MDCISPPALDDLQLLRYLDGEAYPDEAAHLAQCSYCRQRADELTHLQRSLTGRLFRADCPSSTVLGEAQLGLLLPREAAKVARHLAVCPHCAQEANQLRAFLAEADPFQEASPLEQLAEQVKVVIAQLVSGGQLAQPAPAYAGLRGEQVGPSVYEADGAQVMVDFQEESSGSGRLTLLGLVLATTEMRPLEAHLWQHGQPKAQAQADELGNFVFPDLAPGHYELILSSPAMEVHIQDLQAEVPG